MRRIAFLLIGAALAAVVASVALVSRGSASHSAKPPTMMVRATNEKHIEFKAGKYNVVGYYGDLLDNTTAKPIAGYQATCVWLGDPGKMRTSCDVLINFRYGTPGAPQGGTVLVAQGYVNNPGNTLFSTDEQNPPHLAVTGGTGFYLGRQGEVTVQRDLQAPGKTHVIITLHP
jgi:hypothetical protein